MSYTPDIVLDADGKEHYGDSGTVVIGQSGGTIEPNYQENPVTGDLQQIEEIEKPEDLDDPDYVPYEVQLADVNEEIHTTEYTVSEETATQIASVDLGNSPEAVTVQYLAHKVFHGDITPDEAFAEALNSGIAPAKLMKSYRQLKSYFN